MALTRLTRDLVDRSLIPANLLANCIWPDMILGSEVVDLVV
uniref:Uncharacterized protein n=1 Tax=Arundo donax TaxID=35708 RepID=A0A0A9EGD2_ARUDO